VPAAHHAGFIDHLALLSAAFRGWQDTVEGLTTMPQPLQFFDGPTWPENWSEVDRKGLPAEGTTDGPRECPSS
jgi:hypothetical protein